MISKIFIALLAIVSAAPFRDSYENGRLEKRLDNGLGKTPALGWNGWVDLPFFELSMQITYQ
jgi:alpha-galactosidase